MSFDLRHLRYVIAAAEHRSFFQAALALDIEQSTMSRNIVRLERRLGVRLFRRSHAGTAPTAAGAEFVRSARQLLARADQLAEAMRSAGEEASGRLTVGYGNSVPAGRLRDILAAWRKQNPDVALDRIEGQRNALMAGLQAGLIDMAILASAPFARMNHAALWSERLVAGLPASHPLANRTHLEWRDLAGETFLLPADGEPLVHCLRQAGLAPQTRMLQVSTESILAMLGSDVGVTLACEGAVGRNYPDAVLRPVHDAAAELQFFGYWPEDNDNPALRQFLAFVRSRGPDIPAIN